MITLTNGNIQGATNSPITPLGWIELYLSQDGQVVAPPYGQVLGGTTNSVLFYFDSNADLVQPAKVWSNAELNPQNSSWIGTWYVVNFYDMNGTRLNNAPIKWQFTESNGATVDIGMLQPYGSSSSPYTVPAGLNFVDSAVPSGTINGTTGSDGNAVFTLPNVPYPPASLSLYKNGQLMALGTAYTLPSSTITFLAPYIPVTGDTLLCSYRY